MKPNVRLFLSLVAANVVLGASLWALARRSAAVASVTTRTVLAPLDAAKVDAVAVIPAGAPAVRLVCDADRVWRLTAPFAARADEAAALRLADALTLTPVGDVLTDADLRDLGLAPADFGLEPARLSVVLAAGDKTETVFLGSPVASGREIYARVEGLRNVFTVSADVVNAVPVGADAYRSRRVVGMRRADLAEADFRFPGKPFVKLVSASDGWSIRLPEAAPADNDVVASVLDTLYGARIASFVWPSAEDAPDAAAERKSAAAERLAAYGLDGTGASLALRGVGETAERIIFGDPAGSNLVYALLADGAEIVTVPDSLAACCRDGLERFRDTRLFAFSPLTARTVSFAVDARVFTLARDTNGVWALAAPVSAPADAVVVEDVLARTFAARSADCAPDGTGVKVTVTTEKGPADTVVLPASFFGEAGRFLDLRSKTVLSFDPASAVRVSLADSAGRTVTAERGSVRGTWNYVKAAADEAPVRLSDATVEGLLAALSRVEAVGVESLAGTAEDFTRCGFDAPAFTVTAELAGGSTVRRSVLLGGAAPGGGRYATAGGADAVFIVSRKTVAALTVPLTE